MDGSAIQSITDLSVSLNANETLQNMGTKAIVIPDGYELASLEHLENKPDLFRGQFSTSVLDQLVGYLQQHGTANTGVFIDQDKMTAKAIIDMGRHDMPQWGKHRAIAELKQTPAYAALIYLNNLSVDQQTFIDFVEDWSDNIAFYADEESHDDVSHDNGLPFNDCIKLLRKLKVATTATSETNVGNFNANRSAMESIEVSAGNEQPPAGFLFKVAPYDGFDGAAFECQLRAMVDDKAVRLKFRIKQLALHQEQIAKQFQDKIQENVKVDGLSIFIGNMNYQ